MNNIKNYTQTEIDYIKTNFSNLTTQEIAKHLNKSAESIKYVARKLGLSKQPHKPWTDEEIRYLKDNYFEMTSKEIGKYLGRSVHSINAARDKFGLYRDKPWSTNEVDYLIKNHACMSYREIGQVLGRTEGAICAKCFDLNLVKEIPWTSEEIQFLKNNYLEMKTREIALILNRTYNAVELKAHKLGLKKYPYTCDYHYFDLIDTEEKAYWLGFLAADGWISKNEQNNAGVTGIELQYGDINHLKKFNKAIGGNYQITDRWRPCLLSKDKDKKNHVCVIRIFSITMYNALVALGFSSNKSYDFQVPVIKNELIKHFLRGYFDGDGCLTFTNKSFHVGFITASPQLNEDIKQIIIKNEFQVFEQQYVNDFDTKMYRIEISTSEGKARFLDWIYKDASIYLDRKYKKYLQVKKHFENKNTQSLAG